MRGGAYLSLLRRELDEVEAQLAASVESAWTQMSGRRVLECGSVMAGSGRGLLRVLLRCRASLATPNHWYWYWCWYWSRHRYRFARASFAAS